MYTQKTHFHFIGIGGIGMSALAIICKQRGCTVSGSDCNLQQKSISQLQSLGCAIHDAQQPHVAASTDVVVYSAAIAQDHPELVIARERNLVIITRSQLLADLFNQEKGIAIAGAHGKTTTSSLIAHIFMQAHLDPTYAIGGHLHNYDTNACAGSGEFFIAEACENDRTITLLQPHIAIVTNVDREHLDVYKDLDEIKEAFATFMRNVTHNGTIVACHDDVHAMAVVKQLPLTYQKNSVTYGFSPEADLFITDYQLYPEYSTATVRQKGASGPLGTYTLTLPGKHNLLNSLAALATAQKAGISFDTFATACASFKGIDRRFTFKGTYKQAKLFDDYGHHPAEIEQIVKVARLRATQEGGRLIILFQPHRFSRTEKLWPEFIKVFTESAFDALIITDIYAAFEPAIADISSKRLVHELHAALPTKQICYVPEDYAFDAVHSTLDTIVQPHDVVLFLGAGKINMLADLLVKPA